MSVTRWTARLVTGIAVAVVLFSAAFLYERSYRVGSEERRVIGVYTGHGHTIVFRRSHRFSYSTPNEQLEGSWSRRTDKVTGFRLAFDDGRHSGVAALVDGSFAGERGDLALGVSDYWVVLRRARVRSLFVSPAKSPNQAMQRTASQATIYSLGVCPPPLCLH